MSDTAETIEQEELVTVAAREQITIATDVVSIGHGGAIRTSAQMTAILNRLIADGVSKVNISWEVLGKTGRFIVRGMRTNYAPPKEP